MITDKIVTALFGVFTEFSALLGGNGIFVLIFAIVIFLSADMEG